MKPDGLAPAAGQSPQGHHPRVERNRRQLRRHGKAVGAYIASVISMTIMPIMTGIRGIRPGKTGGKTTKSQLFPRSYCLFSLE